MEKTMTNAIYTLENINKLANKMVKVQGLARQDAENMAEFMLKYTDTQNVSELMKRIN
jgi:hypothetical protein